MVDKTIVVVGSYPPVDIAHINRQARGS